MFIFGINIINLITTFIKEKVGIKFHHHPNYLLEIVFRYQHFVIKINLLRYIEASS